MPTVCFGICRCEKQDVMSVTKTPRSNQIECVIKTCMQYVSKLLTDDCRNLVHARMYVEPARDAHMHAKNGTADDHARRRLAGSSTCVHELRHLMIDIFP